MNANEHKLNTEQVLKNVVGAAYEVSNTLGCGFLEKVYERALARELALRGLAAETQVNMNVSYKGLSVGTYVADLIVEDELIVEVKCVEFFANEHLAQSLNYLKASGKKLALLVNFRHPKVEWRRVILSV